jgi:hypothetical protein
MAVRKQGKATLVNVLAELLCRLEQTIPFPVNVEEFYSSLFPKEVVELAKVRTFDVEYRNLRSVLSTGTSATLIVGAGGERFVRMSFANRLPVSHKSFQESSLGLIVVPSSHPHCDAVCEWHAKATKFDEELSEAAVLMRDALEGPLITAWPELAKAVGIKNLKPASLRSRQNLAKLLDPRAKRKYDALLASALLLPKITPPHAWVGLLER